MVPAALATWEADLARVREESANERQPREEVLADIGHE